jgi:hypothetical protein
MKKKLNHIIDQALDAKNNISSMKLSDINRIIEEAKQTNSKVDDFEMNALALLKIIS